MTSDSTLLSSSCFNVNDSGDNYHGNAENEQIAQIQEVCQHEWLGAKLPRGLDGCLQLDSNDRHSESDVGEEG